MADGQAAISLDTDAMLQSLARELFANEDDSTNPTEDVSPAPQPEQGALPVDQPAPPPAAPAEPAPTERRYERPEDAAFEAAVTDLAASIFQTPEPPPEMQGPPVAGAEAPETAAPSGTRDFELSTGQTVQIDAGVLDNLTRTVTVPIDPDNPPGTALGRAGVRGSGIAFYSISALVAPGWSNDKLNELVAENPRRFETVADVDAWYRFDQWVTFGAERIVEMGTTSAPIIAAGMATGGAGLLVVGGTVLGTSTAMSTGQNLMRQIEENGETDPLRAGMFGVVQGALDAIVPAAVGRTITGPIRQQLQTRLLGTVDNVLRRRGISDIAAGVLIEGSTEAIQTALEQQSANPENLRILLNPQTQEEIELSDRRWDEIVNAGIDGAIGGGGMAAGGALISNARTRTERTENDGQEDSQPSGAPAPTPTPPGTGGNYGINPTAGRSPLLTLNGSQSRLTDSNAGANLDAVLNGPYQRMQAIFGAPLTINDAIAKAGTSRETNTRGSQHFHGNALDIDVSGMNDSQRLQVFEAALQAGFSGIGLGRNIIHVDVGPRRAWDYGNDTFGGVSVAQLKTRVRAYNGPGGQGGQSGAPAPTTVGDVLEFYLTRTRGRESGGDDDAVNQTGSSAVGRYQFLRSTWTRYKDRFPEAANMTRAEWLALRTNGDWQERVMREFTSDNAAFLEANNIDVTPQTLYLAHHFGPAGARRLFNAYVTNPATAVSSIVTARVMAQNPYLRGQSVGDLMAGIDSTFEGAPGAAPGPTGRTGAGADYVARGTNAPVADIQDADQIPQRDALVDVFENTLVNDPEGTRSPLDTQTRARMNDRLVNNAGTPVQNMARMAEGDITVDGISLAESTQYARQTLGAMGLTPDAVLAASKAGTKAPLDFSLANAYQYDARRAAGLPISDAAQVRRAFERPTRDSLANSPAKDLVADATDFMARAVEADAQALAARTPGRKQGRVLAARRARAQNDAKAVRDMANLLQQPAKDLLAKASTTTTIQKGIRALRRNPRGRAFADALTGLMREMERSPALRNDPKGLAARRINAQLNTIVRRAAEVADSTGQASRAEQARLYQNRGLVGERITSGRREAKRDIAKAVQTREEGRKADQAEIHEAYQRVKNNLRAELEDYRGERRTQSARPAVAGRRFLERFMSPTNPNSASGRVRMAIGETVEKSSMFFATPRGLADDYPEMHRYNGVPFTMALSKAMNTAGETMERTIRNYEDIAQRMTRLGEDMAASSGALPGRTKFWQRHQAKLDALRPLANAMNSATTYAAYFDNGTRGMSRREFAESLKKADPNDPNSRDGVNAHIPPERHAVVTQLHAEFLRLPRAAQKVFIDMRLVERRDFVDRLNLLARNILSHDDAMGRSQPVNTLAEAVTLMEQGLLGKDTAAAIKALQTKADVKGTYFKLDRVEGDYAIYLEFDQTVRSPTKADAEAQMNARMKGNPHIQSTGRATEVNGQWEVRGMIRYYEIFASKADAESMASVINVDGVVMEDGTKLTPNEVRVQLRSEETIGTSDFDGLSTSDVDAIKAAFKTATGQLDPEVQVALNDIIKAKLGAMATLPRTRALGATTDIIGVSRAQGRRSGIVKRGLEYRAQYQRILQRMEQLQTSPATSTRAAQVNQRIITNEQKKRAAQADLHRQTFKNKAFSTASSLGVAWYLTSVQYLLINSTQPYAYAFPVLAGTQGLAVGRNMLAHHAKLAKMIVTNPRAITRDMLTRMTPRDPRPLGNNPASPPREIKLADPPPLDPATGAPTTLHLTEFDLRRFDEDIAASNGDATKQAIAHQRLELMSGLRKRGAIQTQPYEAQDPVRGFSDVAQRAMETINNGLGSLAERIEFVNRYSVADAMWSDATDHGARTTPLTKDEMANLIERTDEMLWRTNVDYSPGNRSMAQTRLGPLLLFSSFGFHYMHQTMKAFQATFMGPNAAFSRKQGAAVFFGLLGTHLLVGGLESGIPQWLLAGASVPFLLARGLVDMFAPEGSEVDDEIEEMKAIGIWPYLESRVRLMGGDTFTDILFRGALQEATGVDLSQQINLSQGYTFAEIGAVTKSEEDALATIAALAGPIPGIGLQILRTIEKQRQQGFSIRTTAEGMFPMKVGRDIAAGLRVSDEGLRTRSGQIIVDQEEFTGADIMLRMMGLRTSEETEAYRRRNVEFGLNSAIQSRRARLISQIRRSDGQISQSLMDSINQFNTDVIGVRGAEITGSTIATVNQNMYDRWIRSKIGGGTTNETPNFTSRVDQVYGEPD